MKSALARWLVVVPTCLTIACGGRACGSPATSGTEVSGTGPAGLSSPEIPTPEQLTTILDAAEQLDQEIPRETFDVTAVVRNLDPNPEPSAILQWVRDNTAWVPYRGALRGPTGVLMDRLGNSLDRSLLLAEMLRESGRTVRLAQVTLPELRAREVLADGQNASTGAALKSPSAPAELVHLERIAQVLRLDSGQLQSRTAAVAARSERVAVDLAKRIGAQALFLSEAFGKSVDLAKNETQLALRAAADHWWVQVEDDEKWIDLDATLDRAKLGTPINPRRILPFDQPSGEIPVTRDDAHEITIRVMVEQSSEGRPTRKSVLEHRFRPAESFGELIVLQHLPLKWPATADLLRAQNPEVAVKEAALSQKEWLPVLKIGGRTIRQSSFSDVTSEWIEYEVHVPGEADRITRRDVFASTDPAIRALSVLGRIEILPVVARPSRPWTLARLFNEVLRQRDGLSSLSAKVAGNDVPGALDQAEQLEAGITYLLMLAQARFDWSWLGPDVYLDAPNILVYRSRISNDDTRGLVLRQGFDIVANAIGVRGTSRLLPFYARLVQGVVDTNLEALLLDESAKGNAGALLGLAEAKEEWITLRGPADVAKTGGQWPRELRRHIERSLRAGNVVIAPRHAEAGAAFWSVNPNSGETLGIGDEGWGQAYVEYIAPAVAVGASFQVVCFHIISRVGLSRLTHSRIAACTFSLGLWGIAEWAFFYSRPPTAPSPSMSFPTGSQMCGPRMLCR